jgi:F-type H+-transporting ATPase subunit alpha
LDRGARLVELLKQPQFRPMTVEQEVMVIFAGTQGFLDDVPINRIQQFQTDLLAYISASWSQLAATLGQKKELTADLEKQLRQALADFKSKVWKK